MQTNVFIASKDNKIYPKTPHLRPIEWVFGHFYSNLFEPCFWLLIQFKTERIEKRLEVYNCLGNDENFTKQLDWMIHMDTQECLTKICYENCDRIQKYVPTFSFLFDQSLIC